MIAVIDYGLGNLASVLNMLRKTGAEAVVTSDPDVIASAGKLILPGVGAFDAGMQQIHARGLRSVLDERAIGRGVPVLGICLGFQLLAQASTEGAEKGLGWIDAASVRLVNDPARPDIRVPHMGWNRLAVRDAVHPLMAGFDDSPRFYFAHSYHVVCNDSSDVLATVTHGEELVACIAHGNVMGAQFHPEKSHKFGLRLLTNFANLS